MDRQLIIEAAVKMNKEVQDRMMKLFNTAYHLAKEELPFTSISPQTALEKKHGVQLGNTYNNATQAKTFTQYIAADLRDTKLTKYVLHDT